MNISVVVGNALMFKFLAKEIQQSFPNENVQIIIENSYSKENFKKQIKFRIKKYGVLKFIDEVIYRLYESIIQKSSSIYKKYFENANSLEVEYFSEKINDKETELKIHQFNPDILIVFGTSIVKENIFMIPKIGTLNIHPGINPKYKGAGSFWALKNKDFSHYGFTIHLVDKGIDTGDIILSKKVTFDKSHLVLPTMYSNFTIEASSSLIDILTYLKQNNKLPMSNSLTDESGYNTWLGMSDYVSMRWKNRNV
jgi:folate-dependent phosphoribosylglycinamide formyltransferase PurN